MDRKVSVIIPVYNAEKYLGVCLESILIQTLTDFELILVDDCSTDNTCAIAESFLEKFGGRLKIIYLEENTGSGAAPRNVGLEYATGKYVYFMDNDDFIIDTALETLYDYAETYQAEVVYMERYFSCGKELVPPELNVFIWCNAKTLVEEPTLETNNISERMEKFLHATLCWAPWAKFLRRDFLIDNKIFLPKMTIADDVIWTFKLLCLAKKILIIPTPLYVYRTSVDSIMRKSRSPEDLIIFRTSPLIKGLEYLDEFMRGVEYFKRNSIAHLQVLEFFARINLDDMSRATKHLEPQEVYEIFRREFSKAGSTQPALISYLLVMNNLYRNELMK